MQYFECLVLATCTTEALGFDTVGNGICSYGLIGTEVWPVHLRMPPFLAVEGVLGRVGVDEALRLHLVLLGSLFSRYICL